LKRPAQAIRKAVGPQGGEAGDKQQKRAYQDTGKNQPFHIFNISQSGRLFHRMIEPVSKPYIFGGPPLPATSPVQGGHNIILTFSGNLL
jgi:hypothetical protein